MNARMRMACGALAAGLLLTSSGAWAGDAPAEDAGALTRPPALKQFVEASFPEGAIAKGVEANVVLELDVDAEGNVESARLVEQIGGEGFDFASKALEAGRRLVFEPAEVGETKVPVTITYTYKFVLPPPPPPVAGVPPPAPPPPRPSGPNPYDVLVEDKKQTEKPGRRFEDPSAIMPRMPSVSGRIVTRVAPVAPRGPLGGPGRPPPGAPRPGGPGAPTPARPPPGAGPGGGGGGAPGGGPPGGGPPGSGPPSGRDSSTQTRLATLAQRGDIVSVTDSSSGLVLRGLNPANSRVVLDDIDIPQAFHFGSLRPIFPIGMLDEARLYQGSYPLEHGRATGGLLELRSDQQIADRIGGYADASWADMSGVLRVPLARDMSASLSGQYSLLDQMLHEVIGSSYVTLGSLPRYHDAEIKWQYRPSPFAKIQLFGITSSDRFVDWFGDVAAGEPAPGTISLATQFQRAIMTSEVELARNVSAKLVLSAGSDEVRQLNPNFDVHSTKLQGRPSLKWQILKRLAVHAGAEYIVQSVAGTYTAAALPGSSSSSTAPIDLSERSTRSFGGHAGLEWEVLRGLTVKPGSRLDRYWLTDETVIEPRVHASWALLHDKPGIDRLALRAAFGTHHQPPSLLQASTELGNPALKAEKSFQYLVGLDYRPVRSLLLDAAAFYVDLDGVIVGSSSASQVFVNGATGTSRGFELFAQQELWRGLSGWLYYTYSEADLELADGTASVSPYDQSHVGGVMLTWLLPAGWKLSGRFQYASGLPTTTVAGSVFDSTNDSYVSVPGATLGDRTVAFQQLDLRVDKTFELGRGSSLTAYIDVRNATNRGNVVTGYAYNYDSSQHYARTGLPILPIVGVRADF